MELKANDIISFTDGTKATVIAELGKGGQGIVYKVQINDKQYAFKSYKEIFLKDLPDVKKFYLNLERNAKKGPIDDIFVWPLKISTIFEDKTFGYLMNLIPSNYIEYSELVLHPDRINAKFYFFGMIDCCIDLIYAMGRLFSFGLCFQDLNDGSLFIDTETGKLLICDCDNITTNNCDTFVLGKPGFMAPEIYTKKYPNLMSDRFSLAILLFHLCFCSSPFDGVKYRNQPVDKTQDEWDKECFGTNPIYVLNKEDTSNKPNPNIHQNVLYYESFYPQYFLDAFNIIFTKGLFDESERIKEEDWLRIFGRLKNDLLRCPNPECQDMFFYKDEMPRITCPHCSKSFPTPILLKNNDFVICSQVGKKVYRWQVEDKVKLNRSSFEPVGSFLIHEEKQRKVFLNETAGEMSLMYNDKIYDFPNGKKCPIINGTKIKINDIEFIVE